MELDRFERRAHEVWQEIPDQYRAGVDGLVVREEMKAHPTLPEIYTLGECLTESYPSDWGGPDTVRSVLVLYHGSFRELARLDPRFDWEYEVWETVTHELRHHLEWLAAEDTLEDVDYAVDENFRRFQGEPYDPFFYRSGERVAPGLFQAEQDVFMEIEHPADRPPSDPLEIRWQGRRYAVPLPPERGDLTLLQVTEGLDPESPPLCIVLVARRGALSSFWRWLRRTPPEVVDVDVPAEPLEGPGEGEA